MGHRKAILPGLQNQALQGYPLCGLCVAPSGWVRVPAAASVGILMGGSSPWCCSWEAWWQLLLMCSWVGLFSPSLGQELPWRGPDPG